MTNRKTLRPYIAFVISFFVCGFLLYLLGAFYSVSFNIADWSEDTRRAVAGLEFLAGGLVSLGVCLSEGARP